MVDEDDRARIAAQLADECRELAHLAGAQPGERFVEQQQLGPQRHRLGEFETAQTGIGKFRWQPVRDVREPDHREKIMRGALNLPRDAQIQDAVRQQRELDVLQHGLLLQRTRVLEQHGDAGPGDAVRRPAADAGAVEPHVARVGAVDAHHQAHHGRLAGPVRSDEAEDFAAIDAEIDIIDGRQTAEAFAQPAYREQRHDGRPHAVSRPNSPPRRNSNTSTATIAIAMTLTPPSGCR